MKYLVRPLALAAALVVGTTASLSAQATTLYTDTFTNVGLVDLAPGSLVSYGVLDVFSIGQSFNLTLDLNVTSADSLLGFSAPSVTLISVSAKQFDGLFSQVYTPNTVTNIGGNITALFNGLSAGTYDIQITYNGNGVLGTGVGELNGTLTASSVPEPATLALGGMAVLVGLGNRRLRRHAS